MLYDMYDMMYEVILEFFIHIKTGLDIRLGLLEVPCLFRLTKDTIYYLVVVLCYIFFGGLPFRWTMTKIREIDRC